MKVDTYNKNPASADTGAIGETKSANTANEFVNARSFNDLNPGDKFKATITDIKPNQVTIRLLSGDSFTARSMILPEARIGEESIFAVKENFKGQILLEMVKSDSGTMQKNIIKEALANASIVATDENIELARGLIKNGMPLDSDTLQRAVFFKYSNETTSGIDSISKALFLLKEDFKASEVSVNVLNSVMNKTLRLESGIKGLISFISQIEDPEVQKKMIEAVIRSFDENSENIFTSHKPDYNIDSQSKEGSLNRLGYVIDSQSKENSLKQLKNELSSRLFLELTGKNGQNISKYFKNLGKTVVELTEILDSIKKENLSNPASFDNNEDISNIRSNLNDITDNLNFMKQINNYREYIQIPFSVNGSQNQGEVYIFKDSKKSKNYKDHASMLISLDFATLGHVEVFVNKNQQNLNLEFKLENPTVQNLINKNANKLFDMLSAKGFKISGFNSKIIESKFRLTDELKNSVGKPNEKRYAFDMRV